MEILQEVIRLYSTEPLAEFTIRQISQKLGKSYSYTYEKVQDGISRGVLSTRKKGASILCSLNLYSGQVPFYLCAGSIEEKRELEEESPILSRSLNELTAKLQQKLKHNLISLVLFGSLVKGRVTKRSDVDLLVIVPAKEKTDEIIHRECSTLEMRYGRAVNPVIVTPEMFVDMIRSKEQNVAKEVLRGKVVFGGFEKFWELVVEGKK